MATGPGRAGVTLHPKIGPCTHSSGHSMARVWQVLEGARCHPPSSWAGTDPLQVLVLPWHPIRTPARATTPKVFARTEFLAFVPFQDLPVSLSPPAHPLSQPQGVAAVGGLLAEPGNSKGNPRLFLCSRCEQFLSTPPREKKKEHVWVNKSSRLNNGHKIFHSDFDFEKLLRNKMNLRMKPQQPLPMRPQIML